MQQFRMNRSVLPIGIDRGAGGVRLVQARGSWADPHIHCAATWACPSGDWDVAAEAAVRIERFRQNLSFRGRAAVAAVAPPDLEHHLLEIPSGVVKNSATLPRAAEIELHRLTTMDPATLSYASWVLPPSARRRSTCAGITVPRVAVDALVAAVEQCGLHCVKVDIAGCALARFGWLCMGAPAQQVWAVLDLGAAHSRLTMCLDDTPALQRALPFCGRQWTTHLERGLHVSVAGAERYKREFGLAGPARNPQGAVDGASAVGVAPPATAVDRAVDALRAELDQLALEVERSYEYVLQWDAERRPGALVMVGAGAGMPGLSQFLSARLGIDVSPIGRCPAPVVAQLTTELGGATLESCALACALSLQGGC